MFELINVVTRGLMWILSFYRWIRKREPLMIIITLAFWSDFLGVLTQPIVSKMLGVSPDVSNISPLMSTYALLEGIFLFLATMYTLGTIKKAWAQVTSFVVFQVGSLYIVLSTIFKADLPVISAFSVLFMGISMILLGISLLKREIESRGIAALFPIGLILLGSINLTYPLLVYSKLAPYLYGAGAVFRVLMIIGLFKYTIFEVKPPKIQEIILKPGAFYTDNESEFESVIMKMQLSGNGVLITRKLPKMSPTFPVFWITKVTSGRIDENVTAIQPSDIGILIDLVKRHLEKGHSVVAMDAFEYLVVENGFEVAVKFLFSLKDHVLKLNKTLILFTNPQAYQDKQWSVIARELERLSELKATEQGKS
ncbi:DUF835 domain-containing protein [Pyrococcus abyssi]|uniref:DUF835 domain-containing protein n=1 Tax=Pyrococcus abyssi (strain GE5 / Orsay) TaxID=272844 RepID=Q9V124_PYRAB|nr:DUF835 domain-containing protein [Pyrococcus abyssi]CAB49527.1 Hypothetical protein PAB0416 [Pyrococcus abyssi GE5]CCE69997.1 TPA: hypothetical protein PAB0416 [Pyrococcus abyssi GE5]